MQSRDVREQLQRVLRTPEVLFIRINGVVGGGIFLLPGQAAQSAGAATVQYGPTWRRASWLS
jgi:basic amino acid/polyamine antiporter, APA family